MVKKLSILLVLVMLLGLGYLWLRGLVKSGTAIGSLGLLLDIVGAVTVLSALPRQMALFRQADRELLKGAMAPLQYRIPFLVARALGSTRSEATIDALQYDFAQTFWGAALLALGFALQLIAAWLPSGHAWRL